MVTQVTQELEQVRLVIPEPFFSYDWDEAININQGETVKLLKVCKMQSEMLRTSRNWPVNPETLAWMTLWTRNFNLVQGTISILESRVGIARAGQEFTLRMLWRPTFELWVTLNFILKESPDLFSAHGTEKQTLDHRLCAYLAWCFWNDKEFAHKLTQGWRLDTIFPNGKALTPEDDQILNQVLELLWGDENAANVAGGREKKRLVRQNSLRDRNQFIKWLQHERLRGFEDRIRKQRPLSYFELVDPENNSLLALLRSSWAEAGYPTYQEGSALIHGSTFARHMELISDQIFPRIVALDGDVQEQAGHIRRHCNFNARIIQSIQERMEREELA
jgi:hypothetical protein